MLNLIVVMISIVLFVFLSVMASHKDFLVGALSSIRHDVFEASRSFIYLYIINLFRLNDHSSSGSN